MDTNVNGAYRSPSFAAINGAYRSPSFASQRHVTYSCGSCGYDLNLSSSNRNTATIGSKYGKSIKRGIISFFQIDESRFTQVDEIHCVPCFNSNNSWGLFRKKTKLLCRKCGNRVGNAYEYTDYSPVNANEEGLECRKYDIRIRALQPSSSGSQHGTPFYG